MNRPNFTVTLFAAFGFFVVCGSARANIHYDGQAKINGKGDGKHALQSTAQGHVAHATVHKGKVKNVTVTRQGVSVAVTKFKTSKRLHAQAAGPDNGPIVLEYDAAAAHVLAAADGGDENAVEVASAQIIPLGATTFVGYGFFNPLINQWVVYWFPVNLVTNGDLGATAFNPVLPAPVGGTAVLNTNGFCPLGQAATYNVQLQAGKQYFITLRTVQPNYHPFLAVYNVNGQLLAQDVDSAGFPNARILFTPLTTGTYKIGCGSVNNATGGAFTLTVQ